MFESRGLRAAQLNDDRSARGFFKKIRDWDEFGVDYVETSQTFDYVRDLQNYGGLSLLSEEDRRRVIDLIFGDDSLKPGIVKMFLDPFHQAAEQS